MKRSLFILVLAASAFGCKKNNPTPQYDLSGTWVLSSTKLGGPTITVADYPCIANLKLIFGTGNSATVSWKTTGACWIDQAHTTDLSATDGTVLTFTRQGNDLTFPPASSVASKGHGTITSVNGKLQLSIKDTIVISTQGTFYGDNEYIKQ